MFKVKLLIVSHTPHYRQTETLVGWGATVREIDHLATLFDQIIHIAPVHLVPPPPSAIAYQSARVRVRPVLPAGGNRLIDKFGILTRLPGYLRVILDELKRVDMVHVRCPANISLFALVLLTVMRHPSARWFKYAGNWRPNSPESWSYTFQRWWLHHNWARGRVTINGAWPDQRPHEFSFPNPSLTRTELETGVKAATIKRLMPPYRCVFIGVLDKSKGPHVLIEAIRRLLAEEINIEADLIGDGPQASELKRSAQDLTKAGRIRFHGWLARPEIPALLSQAHFIVLPSRSEGWPKVLSEGMAYGAVPIATAVSAIPHYLKSRKNGWLLQQPTVLGVVEGIKWFLADPSRWVYCQHNALTLATQFTYDYYLKQVAKFLMPKDRRMPGFEPSGRSSC